MVVDAEFSPDTRSILTASLDGTAGIWNITGAQMEFRLVGHVDSVNDVSGM
jgi:WD40 repeat protein